MVAVRLGNSNDLPAVRQIIAESGLQFEAARSYYTRLVAVDEDGAIIGFIDGLFNLPVPDRAAAAAPGGPQAWGNYIVIAPDVRGRGVGQTLVRAFVAEAQTRGCTFLAAMVSQADDRTQRVAFFRRCGMYDLVPGVLDDIVGAPIADILTALAD
jgi:GNAT superfamily N-acetyltransferase